MKISRLLMLCMVVISLTVFLTSCHSYDNIRNFKLFHHFEYNGNAYYITTEKIPDEFIPFGDEVVEVVLVDHNGEPYDASKTEEAWTYQNDTDKVFLYFNSDPYTKDVSLVDPAILNGAY